MPSPGDVRAAGAYAELSVQDALFSAGLAAASQKIQAFATQAQKSMATVNVGAIGGDKSGFFAGSFKSTELLDTGLKFTAAIGMVKAAVADARIFTDLMRGDFEAMRKDVEALPFGLGEIAKQIAGPVDEAAQAIILGVSDKDYVREQARMAGERKVQAAKDAQAAKAINAANEELAKKTMSAPDYAKHQVEALYLEAGAAEKLLGIKMAILAIDERDLKAKNDARGSAAEGERVEKMLAEDARLRKEYVEETDRLNKAEIEEVMRQQMQVAKEAMEDLETPFASMFMAADASNAMDLNLAATGSRYMGSSAILGSARTAALMGPDAIGQETAEATKSMASDVRELLGLIRDSGWTVAQ